MSNTNPPPQRDPTEPSRPTADEVASEFAEHLHLLAGPGAIARPEQLEAVTAAVAEGRRTLLVARTGFGKSAVYFGATRMLRDRGWGPTVVISPLIALMRDQVAAANKLGLKAETINSSNIDDWDAIEARVIADEIDLLLIAPERLANQGFRDRVFSLLRTQAFALVCDEAHCISDWGHDFRPDYLRLRQLLNDLPSWTPVLATTATANQRVTDDVAGQLGAQTLVLRTSLDRESLHLSVVELDDDSQRLAWLAQVLGRLGGSGIIYCLTVSQAETTARWLQQQGYAAAAYTGSTDPTERVALEDSLRSNELKALVATSALGMGFDKPDMAFCVHLGLPPTPVAYYQQIGRAGRALEHAEVIALPRPVEDAAVWRWFESVSLPSEQVCNDVLAQLHPTQPTSIARLETMVNLGRSRLTTLLSILEVAGAVSRTKGGWRVSPEPFVYDEEKATRLRKLRRDEADQMAGFGALTTCRLKFLRDCLDDAESTDCGRCDRCAPPRWNVELDPGLVGEAQQILRGGDIGIEPRRQWPSGLDEPKGRIAPDRQALLGRALSRTGDGGWSLAVDTFLSQPGESLTDDDVNHLVAGLQKVLRRWDWTERPTWICPVPSRRHHEHIDRVAAAIGELGKLPVHRALIRNGDGGWQSEQANSAHQVANLWGRLAIEQSALPPQPVLDGPVLLIDDRVDSRWTITIAASLLTDSGVDQVLPLTLAST